MNQYETVGFLEIYEIWMTWICLRILFTPKMAAFFWGGTNHPKPWDFGVPVFRQTHLRRDI